MNLAAKWGLVSGANVAQPDHRALRRQISRGRAQGADHEGVRRDEATDIAKVRPVMQRKRWQDGGRPSKARGSATGRAGMIHRSRWRKTASGQSNQMPGIALPSRVWSRQDVRGDDARWAQVHAAADRHRASARTGRGIDITSSAATQMGYTREELSDRCWLQLSTD